MRKFASPSSIIWVLVHIVLALAGFILIAAKPINSWVGYRLDEAIGGSLIAAGFAGVVLFVYILQNETAGSLLKSMFRAGLRDIFAGRSVLIREEYETRLRSASKIDIMGFGLSSLREDYLEEFRNWSLRAEVRILLLDPEYPSKRQSYANQRDKEENNTIGKIASDVEKFEESVRNISNLNTDKFRIKLMHALPSTNVFRIDDEVFFGPYLMGKQSRNAPTFLAQRGGYLYDAILRHFEAVWNDDALATEIILKCSNKSP